MILKSVFNIFIVALGLLATHAMADSDKRTDSSNGCTKAQLEYMFAAGYQDGLNHCEAGLHKSDSKTNTKDSAKNATAECSAAILQAQYKAGYDAALESCGEAKGK